MELDQQIQHAACFRRKLDQQLGRRLGDVIQLACDQNLRLEFKKGPSCLGEKVGSVAICEPALPFCDIAWNGYSSPSHLADQPIQFIP